MSRLKDEAKNQGMRPQEWVRRLIKETLGEAPTNLVLSTDSKNATTVTKEEFDAVIEMLTSQLSTVTEEVEKVKKLG